FEPDAIHISTEGPLGLWIRQWLARQGLNFTTSFHTRFPDDVKQRAPLPLASTYALERLFHGGAEPTLVGTAPRVRELRARRGGRRLVHWPRGVGTEEFSPDNRRAGTYPFPRPVWLYVGRVAVEKSLEAFLRLSLPGTKVVVGEGPARPHLQQAFP